MVIGDTVVTEGCRRVQIPPHWSFSSVNPTPVSSDHLEQPSLSLGDTQQRLNHTSHSGLFLPVAITYKHQWRKSRNHSHETDSSTGCKTVLFLISMHLICSLSKMQPALKHKTKLNKKSPLLTNSSPVFLFFFLCYFPWFSTWASPSSLFIFHLLFIKHGLTSASISVPCRKHFATSQAENQKNTM